jgi:hypothetical protein
VFCRLDIICEWGNALAYFASASATKEKSFMTLTPRVNVLKLFSSSLMMRPNKLKGLPLEILSSQVLEFEGKVRANPIGGPFRSDGSFLGKLLVLPANVRLNWKVIARNKHSSLFGLIVSNKE